MHLKMSSVKWRPFCLGLNVLTHWGPGSDDWCILIEYIHHSLKWFIIGSDKCCVACSAPSHNQNQCWIIVSWNPMNKFNWNLLFINSLAPGRYWNNFKKSNFQIHFMNLIFQRFIWNCPQKNATWPHWWSDDGSTLVQVMAWCCQATSHYLSHCWHRSISPYTITRPQWVKELHLKMSSELWPVCSGLSVLTLVMLKLEYSDQRPSGQYHGCWCPGPLHQQGISSHGIDCLK